MTLPSPLFLLMVVQSGSGAAFNADATFAEVTP
jgi:hypothetical protein